MKLGNTTIKMLYLSSIMWKQSQLVGCIRHLIRTWSSIQSGSACIEHHTRKAKSQWIWLEQQIMKVRKSELIQVVWGTEDVETFEVIFWSSLSY